MPDRFTADEARRIFARAARRQHVTPPVDGLSVADLEAIGREAGLDPALVVAEARAERFGQDAQKTWHGVPVGVRRSRLLPSRLSDAAWERVVDVLREEFNLAGVSEQIGRRREWATMASPSGSVSSAYRLRVEERLEGDFVTITAPNVTKAIGVALGSTLAGVAVFLGAMIGTLKPEKLGEALTFASVFLALGAVLYGAMLLTAKLSAARAPGRLDALLDRIDLISRLDDASPSPTASGRLDPALLDADAEVGPDALPTPRRARA